MNSGSGTRRPRILVLIAHPRSDSLTHALADTYVRNAREAGANVRVLRLAALRFARDVTEADIVRQPLEPDLCRARADILWAQHLVLVYPTWWGTYPALMKAFLDRVLTPGFAFRQVDRPEAFEGLLGGRSAHLVTTMDTPGWVWRLIYGRPGQRALARATLGFCGIGPTRITEFGPVHDSTPERRAGWLQRLAGEAKRLRGAVPTPGERVRRKAGAWARAVRIQFYPMSWLAYAVGGMLAMGGGAWSAPAFWLGLGAIFCIELATVFANERFDRDTDAANRNFGPFNGGARVIAQGRLTARELAAGSGVALAGAVGFGAAALAAAPGAVLPPLAGLLLLAVAGLAYTMPPLALSYRTLGEVDVALTHGPGVMLAGFLLLGGAPGDPVPWLLSLPLAFAILPSIILAGIPDYEADAAVGKRSIAVRFGRHAAAAIAALATALSLLAAAFVGTTPAGALHGWLFAAAVPHALLLLWMLHRAMRKGRLRGRIDGLMVVSLTYLVWFVLIPFLHLV